MVVNSAFKSFFNKRVMGYGVPITIGIALLAIFFISSSFTPGANRQLRTKQTNLMIRQIGHQLLLLSGDSTSRVMPVTEIREGTFLLKFENRLVFNHDSIMMLSQRFLPKAQFPSGYTVTVQDCLTAGIVYGFQFNNTSPDIRACSGRSEPAGCYTIEFTFPDFYASVEKAEKAEQKKADIDQPTEEVKSVDLDLQEVNSIPITNESEEFKTATFGYPFINLVYSGMLVLLGVALLIARFGKSLVPVSVSRQNQNPAIINEFIPQLPALGKFSFDVKDQRLLMGTEVISLTDKECKILELLNKNFGELIPRETLMQEIWINEGVFTGRSLDMFVSKLRKKLSSDPELSITNVHGKGYKLEK